MLSKILIVGGLATALELDAGDICLGYDTCKSGCCLKNIDLKSNFYPYDFEGTDYSTTKKADVLA